MSSMDTDGESLIEEPLRESSSHRNKRRGLIAGAVGLAGLVGVVGLAFHGSKISTAGSQVYSLQGKEERIDIAPSLVSCSKASENCYATGCCQVSGQTCWKMSVGIAHCNATCTKGICEVVENGQASVPVAKVLGQSLYCFSAYTKNTGSPKKSTELDLLKLQKKHDVSIFACDAWDVFSDVNVPIGDYITVKVTDEFGEFHVLKRKESGAWVNWGMFYQIWVKVREVGKWEQKDYTVKVDPDAVFVPTRLQQWLSTKKGDSPHGIYYENCKGVQYGMFGNLEVISNTAASVLTKYLENCHAEFAPCANDGCDWEYGPWGEDVFAQRCMDHHYVDKVEAFDLTTDGACKADRPKGEKTNKKWHAEDCSKVETAAAHPFKKEKDYFKCLGEMTQKTYDL